MKNRRYLGGIIFILLVFLLSACSLREDIRPEKTYKPMIKYNDQIYQMTDDRYEPAEELIEVGEIEESYMDGVEPISLEDKDFTSNVIDKGTILYQEMNSDYIIVKGNEGMLKFEALD